MQNNYSYFIEKSSVLIYKLIVGKGDAKSRLYECKDEIYTIYLAPVPEELKKLQNSIFEKLHKKPALGEYVSSFQNTMYYMKNKDASKIISDIYALYLEVKRTEY